jgi:hypothetical protein
MRCYLGSRKYRFRATATRGKVKIYLSPANGSDKNDLLNRGLGVKLFTKAGGELIIL